MMRRLDTLLVSLVWLGAAALPLTVEADGRTRGMNVSAEITAQDIADLGELGANLARFQLVWPGETADTATLAEYNTWLEGALTNLDSLLPAFESAGIRVMLTLHTPPGGFVSRQAPALHRVFQDAAFQQAFIDTWVSLATRYASSSVIMSYDLLNEPAQREVAAGLRDWNALAQDAAEAIRAIDTTHTIIVEPIYGDQARMGRLRPLEGIDNVQYSIHYYYLLKFVQQGLYGNAPNRAYPTKKFNKRALKRKVQRALRFERKHGEEVRVDEFAANRCAPGRSAYKYLRDLTRTFERRRWSWTLHAWREADIFSIEHGNDCDVTTESPTMTDREELIRSLFNRNNLD